MARFVKSPNPVRTFAATCSIVCLLLAGCGLAWGAPLSATGQGAQRRHLLQNATSKCSWDSNSKVCQISEEVARSLAKRANSSRIKDFVLDVVHCNYRDEDTCTKKDGCKWDSGAGLCELILDVTEMKHFTRCVGRAAVFLDMKSRFQACALKARTKDACNVIDGCTWFPTPEICVFDIWEFLTGVPSAGLGAHLPKGAADIMDLRAREIADELDGKEFDKPSEILSWNPPPFKCPAAVDQVICIVSEKRDRLVLMYEYCASKLDVDGVCDEEYCEVDGDGACAASEAVEQGVFETEVTAYMNMVGNPTASEILFSQMNCIERSKDTCVDGEAKCKWDKEDDICNVAAPYVYRTLAMHPVNEADPNCYLTAPIFKSGCMQMEQEECEDSPKCLWDRRLCVPGPLAFLDILFNEQNRSDLAKELKEAEEGCWDITEKENCN